jgi:hypothetical protein
MPTKETKKPPLHLCKSKFDPKTVGVLLTSHPRQQKFWDACLPCWDNSPFYVLMGYDDVNIDKIEEPMSKYKGINDIFWTGQRTGHVRGELLQFKMGFTRLYKMGFHYALKVGADHLIRRMDGVKDLWALLEGRYGSDPEETIGPLPDSGHLVGVETAFMFGFTGVFYSMFSDFDWKTKNHVGDAENYARYKRRMLNYKVVPYPKGVKYTWDGFSLLDMDHVQGLYAQSKQIELGRRVKIKETWSEGEIY